MEIVVIDLEVLRSKLGSMNGVNSILGGIGNVMVNSQFNHPLIISGENNILSKSKATALNVTGKENFVIDSEFFSNNLGHLTPNEVMYLLQLLEDPNRNKGGISKILNKVFNGMSLRVGLRDPNGYTYFLELGKSKA